MKKSTIHVCQQNLFDLEAVERKPEEKPREKQKSVDSHVFDLIDALTAPVLTFTQLWADAIPQRLLDILPMARMIALKNGEELATYAECVIYICTRSFEAPMDSDWVDIYTHVSCQTLQDWFGEDHWKYVGAPRELTDWLRSKLKGLQSHIYNKRREILKGRLRAEEAFAKKMEKIDEEEENEIGLSEQQSLF